MWIVLFTLCVVMFFANIALVVAGINVPIHVGFAVLMAACAVSLWNIE